MSRRTLIRSSAARAGGVRSGSNLLNSVEWGRRTALAAIIMGLTANEEQRIVRWDKMAG